MSGGKGLAYHDAMQAISQTILCAAITGATDGVLDDCVGLLHSTARSCGGRPLRSMTDRILAQFATPEVRRENQVELTVVPNDDYVAKVGAAAGSSGLPDLFAADIVYVPNWAQQGLFQLTRNVEVTDRTYANLLDQQQQLNIARESAIGTARLIDAADVDFDTPAWPKPLLVVGGGTALGALLMIAFVLMRQTFKRGDAIVYRHEPRAIRC